MERTKLLISAAFVVLSLNMQIAAAAVEVNDDLVRESAPKQNNEHPLEMTKLLEKMDHAQQERLVRTSQCLPQRYAADIIKAISASVAPLLEDIDPAQKEKVITYTMHWEPEEIGRLTKTLSGHLLPFLKDVDPVKKGEILSRAFNKTADWILNNIGKAKSQLESMQSDQRADFLLTLLL